MYAAASNNEEIVKILVKDENSMRNHAGETALLIAAAQDSFKVIPILLPYEHEMVMLNGATALHVAIQHGSVESIPLLIDSYSSSRDRNGFTAMEYCAYNNLLTQLSLLVKYGHYTIEDLKHAASIADSMGHKKCAAALWRASNTYPGTSLNLSSLKITTTHIDVPPNSIQDVDSLPESKLALTFATIPHSHPLTITQLDGEKLQAESFIQDSENDMQDDSERTCPSLGQQEMVLTSGSNMPEDTNILPLNPIRECSGSTSPSIFQGKQESVLAPDGPQGGDEIALSSSSLDSSIAILASQLSGTDKSTQRSEVRILVEHLRSALEQARSDLKDKTITILKLEEQVKQLTEDKAKLLSGSLSENEALSLREEVQYYKHLLVKRDAHEKELKQEISRLQNESTDVLSSLRCKIKQDQEHSEDIKPERLENNAPLPSREVEVELQTDSSYDLCALAYAVKQLWTILDLQETSLPVPEVVPETITITDILFNLKFLGVHLQNLINDTYPSSSVETAFNDKLKTSNEQIEQLIEELSGRNSKVCQLEQQLAEAQTSVDQYKQLAEAARGCQVQSEARLSQYFEVHRNELALITDEVNSVKETIIRAIEEPSGTIFVPNNDVDSSSPSSRSLTYYVELILAVIKRHKETSVSMKQELEQLQADNDALMLANAELKRLNDILEQPIKFSCSTSDTAVLEAKIVSLETKNTDLHNELVDSHKKIYNLQNELTCYKDKLLTAHSSEEIEAVKLRSQLSMYVDAYKTLKDSFLSTGQELDLLRSELDLYRSLRGSASDRRQSKIADSYISADTQQTHPSMLESSNMTAASEPLLVTAIRQTVMTPLMTAAQKGSLRECRNNIHYARQQLSDGMTALMFAASAGNKDVVEFLAPYECSFIRKDNMCAAEIALTNGYYDCAEILRGAEALHINSHTSTAGSILSTLISAAKSNNLFAVWSLLPDQKGMKDDQGMTALMHATALGYKDIVRLLAKYEQGLQDNRGKTALMFAAENLHSCVLEFLISEINLKDNDNKSVIDHLPSRTDTNGAVYDCFIEALR